MTGAGISSPAAVLRLDDEAATTGADPLGLWRALPAASAMTTGAGAATPAAGLVWLMCLPAGPAADAMLTRAELSLAETRAVLLTVEPLLLAVAAWRAATPFADPGEPRAAAELELSQLLTELRTIADTGPTAGFAPGCLPGRWKQVLDETSAFLARLDRATGDPTRVETEQGGRVLAVTELGWRGTKTAWLARPDTAQRMVHERAVRLAFASRLAMLHAFATAISASTLLAALLIPGAAPLAFPAALRFTARVLAEARQAHGP